MENSNNKKSKKKVLTNEEVRAVLDETHGDITLHEIGELFDITRMRVCQIEKISLKKLAENESLKDIFNS